MRLPSCFRVRAHAHAHAPGTVSGRGRVGAHAPVWVLAPLLSILLASAVFGLYDTPSTRVVIIHSYSTDFQWTRDLDAGIRDVLQGDSDRYSVISSEYLDGKFYTHPQYLESFAGHLRTKYANRPIDVLIVTDNLGLEFVREYRNSIFGEVPTVFAGINDYEPSLTEGLTQVTGVPEEVSIEETLRLALDLFPGERLIVLGDGTLTYQRNEAVLRRALEEIGYGGRVEIYPEITFDEVARVADGVDAGDVVFLASSVLEADGTVADFYRAGTVVSDLMPVPVFAMWDFFMGTGVAGGFLASGREQGRSAAEIVQRILAGTSVESIPVQSSSPNRWIFDMEPLRIAGVAPQQIPQEAARYNETHSFWREYRAELSWLAALVTVMGTLIVLLMQSRRTRAVAAGRLQNSLREKEILLKEIHHRVKNNLQVISSILSMQREFISDQQSLDYFKDCETRVQSMALVHEQLYQTESLAQIHLPTYLEELLSSVYSSGYGEMNGTSEGVTVRQEVADLSLLLDQAIPVGLMVNELVSNALKYAYPEATMAPRIIALTVVRVGSDVQISVRDWGIGLKETVGHTDSLGLQLVHALTSQLQGVVAFEEGHPGLLVRITFPLGATVGEVI